jgi:hypothetical protein
LPPNSRVAIPVMNILARAFPRGVMPDVLADHVYGLRVDGGPDSGVKSLAVVIGHLRLKLAPYGWTISDARKGEGYRLERVAAQ